MSEWKSHLITLKTFYQKQTNITKNYFRCTELELRSQTENGCVITIRAAPTEEIELS